MWTQIEYEFKTISSIVILLCSNKVACDLTLVALKDYEIVEFIYGSVLSADNNVLLPQYLFVKEDFRRKGTGSKSLFELEYKSDCNVSQIYFHKDLHDYYVNQGYSASDELEVSIKKLPV